MSVRIHVVDPNHRRRAQIAHEMTGRGLHAEIYESIDEFAQSDVREGYVFAADADDICITECLKAVLAAGGRALPIVIYSDRAAPDSIVEAMLRGAVDYLEWPFRPEILRRTFKRLATEGERRAQLEALQTKAAMLVSNLSRRERQVLRELVRGSSNKEIAGTLQISVRTVEIHRSNALRKLNAMSSSDAVRIGLYAGLDENLRLAA